MRLAPKKRVLGYFKKYLVNQGYRDFFCGIRVDKVVVNKMMGKQTKMGEKHSPKL